MLPALSRLSQRSLETTNATQVKQDPGNTRLRGFMRKVSIIIPHDGYEIAGKSSRCSLFQLDFLSRAKSTDQAAIGPKP